MRLAMLSAHYRQPIDWTVDRLKEAHRNIEKFRRWRFPSEEAGVWTDYEQSDPHPDLITALSDDLNTPEAIASLHRQVSDLSDRRLQAEPDHNRRLSQFRRSLELLGLGDITNEAPAAVSAEVERHIGALIAARLAARKGKDFAESDRIRDELAAMGIQLKDGKDPATGEPVTTWEVAR